MKGERGSIVAKTTSGVNMNHIFVLKDSKIIIF